VQRTHQVAALRRQYQQLDKESIGLVRHYVVYELDMIITQTVVVVKNLYVFHSCPLFPV